MPEATALGYENTAFPFMMLIWTLLASVVILLLECLNEGVNRLIEFIENWPPTGIRTKKSEHEYFLDKLSKALEEDL